MSRTRKEILRPPQKMIFYVVCGLLWLTGVVWIYFCYCVHIEVDFGIQTHPAQTIMLRIHGAAAMIFCIILGTMLYHIRPGWKQKLQRFSGLSLIIVCIFLILSGWGLYYEGNEQLRNFISTVHSVLGIIFPGIVFFHVWRIIQDRSKASHIKVR